MILKYAVVAVPVFAGYAQFFDDASEVGFALSTARNKTSSRSPLPDLGSSARWLGERWGLDTKWMDR
jgi:hypothetical protein